MDYNSLKYIITVNKHQSITKAADELFLSQPNISKAIKHIEDEVGFQIFIRGAKGVKTTSEGQEFIREATGIVKKFEMFSQEYSVSNKQLTLNISYPRATYIADGIANYLETLENQDKVSISLYETNFAHTVEQVVKDECSIGIVRYNEAEAAYCRHLVALHDLTIDPYYDYKMLVAVNQNSPLASRKFLTKKDLLDYVGIINSNQDINNALFVKDNFYFSNKNIRTADRGSKFDMLRKINNTYMFVSPLNNEAQVMYGIKLIPFLSENNHWHDAFIYKKRHNLNTHEKAIMNNIKQEINKILMETIF